MANNPISHLPKNLQQHLSTSDNHNKNNNKKNQINRKRRGTDFFSYETVPYWILLVKCNHIVCTGNI